MVARSGRLRRTKAVDRPGDAQKGAGTSYVVPRVSMDESPDVASLTLRNRVAPYERLPFTFRGTKDAPLDVGQALPTA